MTLLAGTTKTIRFTSYDNLNVTWISSSSDIATVSPIGEVYGLRKGSATITAFVNGLAFKCNVKVVETNTSNRSIVKAAPIRLAPTQSFTIKQKGFKPSNALWSSNRTMVPLSELPNNVVFEDNIVRITKTGKVSAVGAGTTRITAKNGTNNYTFTIIVAEPVVQTVHMNIAAKKNIVLNGFKSKLDWKDYDTSVVQVRGNSIKGISEGTTTLKATYENFEYKVIVYVENPEITVKGIGGKYPKYTLNLKAGQTIVLTTKKTYQTVLFRSNKNNVAFVDEAGVLTARSAGKATVTAKVNGKTMTIKVNVTE